MRSQFANDLEDYYIPFMELCMNMAILAADKVNITNKGIELTMPKREEPLTETIPALPDTRRF